MTKKPAPKKSSQAEGSRGSLWTYDPFELVIVGLDTKDRPDHYLYDAESLAYDAERDDAMIANVRRRGVLKPVLIERDGDRNLVVDGRSRVRWARAAAKLQKDAGEVVLKVRCVVVRGKPAEVYGISRAAQRHRPDDSDVAQARQLQRMIDMVGSEGEAATELAITPLRARKLLALLTTDPKVQTAVTRGMSLDAAARLAKLPREQQIVKLAEIEKSGEKPTARTVTNKLREDGGKPPVETLAHKVKRIREALTAHDEGLAESEEANELAQAFVEHVRAILRPPTLVDAQQAEREHCSRCGRPESATCCSEPPHSAAQEAEFGA
ncbi:MAG TPA: hypothetical protein VI172_00825 [Candidatus Dormibacteraeota bacterium]